MDLGDGAKSGTFVQFVAGIKALQVAICENVSCRSPSLRAVEVGWAGLMTVDGIEVNLGPYKRWENKHRVQNWGTNRADIEWYGMRYQMDVETPARRY